MFWKKGEVTGYLDMNGMFHKNKASRDYVNEEIRKKRIISKFEEDIASVICDFTYESILLEKEIKKVLEKLTKPQLAKIMKIYIEYQKALENIRNNT